MYAIKKNNIKILSLLIEKSKHPISFNNKFFLETNYISKQDRRLIIIKRKIIIYEQIIRNGQIIKRLITEISKKQKSSI